MATTVDPELQFESVMALLKDELKTKAILTAPTLASFAGGVQSVSNNLSELKSLNEATGNIMEELTANRHNFEWCTKFCQENSWIRNYNIEGVRDFQITNEQQFQEVIHRLGDNISNTKSKINSIQTKLDGIAISFIIVNVGMVLENIHWYCTNSAIVKQFRSKLTDLKTKAESIYEWYEKCPKEDKEVNHFRSNVLQVCQELAIIEVKLEALRKESLSKGLTHIATGLSTVVLSFIIPVSAPLFYGMALSGGVNALSSAGNFSVVGKIDDLLPLINSIRALCSKYLTQATTSNGSLPVF